MVEHEFWFENSSALGVFGPIKSKPNYRHIHGKLQCINLTAESETTNRSPLTDLDMQDQFANSQSNGAVLVKNHSSLEHRIPACLPYISGLTEPLTRLHRKNEIRVVNKPFKTLAVSEIQTSFRSPM